MAIVHTLPHNTMKINTALAASVASLALSGSVLATSIQWVDIKDQGNTADTTGFGSVGYEFRISKFEFTNNNYVAFLNAVDQTGTNPYGIYNSGMSTGNRGGINYVPGNPNGSKYVVKTDFGDKPVNYVGWWEAARVANWMHNGATVGASTETGSYSLGGAVIGTTPAKSASATFWIPSQDEWYKAAFYKTGGTNAGYWEYATQSETAPTKVGANAQGVGNAGPVGQFANYAAEADWNGMNGNVTSVGTNGGPSAYGTYDMGGNLSEVISLGVSTNARFVGGGFSSAPSDLSATSAAVGATFPSFTKSEFTGFRLAAAVPEPGSTLPILSLFGLALSKSRRRKA